MGKAGLIISIVLGVIALGAIIFDRNKIDKLLAALLLVFVAQGICGYFIPKHTVSGILLLLCAPAGLAFIILAGRRLKELFGKKR